MKVLAIKTRIFKENENIVSFIVSYIPKLLDNSVLVVTSKIVALSEGRTCPIGTDKEKEKLIRSESEFAIKTENVWLTIKDGMVLANAGIDESNADGKIILLPKDSYKSARDLRKKLLAHYGIKNLGILITDSRLLPLRAGVVGVALGYAGFKGVRDYRGTPDIFGRNLKMTRTDIADALATSAVLLMGEGRECQPLAIIEDAPVDFCEKINKKELNISIEDDLYTPLFRKQRKIGKK